MLTEKDFIAADLSGPVSKAYKLKDSASSNIALVKYWGKYGQQLPVNPSVSFTLNKSQTHTEIALQPLTTPSRQVSFEFYFEGKRKTDFEPKIAGFFQKISPFVPFIHHFEWKIDSFNTFPHSSGIASSASAFATLAKIIAGLEKQLFPSVDEGFLKKKASFLARLGSGSASRSIEHPVMIWGEHPEIPESSNLYAIRPDFELHPIFKNFQDSIVLIEKGQKQVSSTAGHALMNKHPYKEIRKKQAFDRAVQMYQILQNGDIERFIEITESEALELHALMMTSQPGYILMQPGTLEIIHRIRNIRKEKNIPVCFSLDAGANVHVLYPASYKKSLQQHLWKDLKTEVIHDFI